MIQSVTTVHCDVCRLPFGPRFVSEQQAQAWIADDDEDFDEYGQFADGVPRVGDVFHPLCNKTLCADCTQAEIDRTKGKSNAKGTDTLRNADVPSISH